ncbi:MAG: hypothetical protein GY755_02420 [Chloroflexi bacterium]|nr:hypothetical protein [Chloroflexota bacterium]
MQNLFYLLIGGIQLVVGIIGVQKTAKFRSAYAVLILTVIFGLTYDNFVLGVGNFMGEGALLKTLSAPRFYIHALFTPAMMIAVFGMMLRFDIGWAQSKKWHIFICVVATVLIALGIYTDIIQLDLMPNQSSGVLRYSNEFEFMKGPPIPAVLTILFVLVFSLFIWKKARWPWLFLGALIMFATAPVASKPIMQNVGEIAFALGLITTEIKAHAHVNKTLEA